MRNDKCLPKRHRREMRGREGHEKRKTDTEVMQSQDKECPESPEAGKGKGIFSPEATGGSRRLWTT